MESKVYDEIAGDKVAETVKYTESYGEAEISNMDSIIIDDVLSKTDVAESEPVVTEVLQEETDLILQEEFYDGINEPEVVEPSYESVNEFMEAVVEGDVNLQKVESSNMTKERYEALTDKEKVEWLGIADCNV